MNCCIGQFPWSCGYFGSFGGFNIMNRYATPFNMFFGRGQYRYGFNCGYPGNWAAMVGQQAGQRAVVRITYESLLENLNNLTFDLSSMSGNNKLTTEDEEKLEKFKKQTQDLLNKATNYGKNSQNILFSTATDKIFKYQKEYYNLRDAVNEFKKELSTRATTKPETPSTPEAPTTPETPETPPQTDNPNVETEKRNQIAQKYNSELRPKINELLKSRDITAEDKKALKEKSDEFVQAVKDKKASEEVQKLYDELEALTTEVAARVEKAKTEREARELQKAIESTTKFINEVKKYLRENQKYTNKSDRTALLKEIEALNETLENNPATDDIIKKQKEIEKKYIELKQRTSNLIQQSDAICNEILEAADGIDWSMPWSGDTENEKKIKQAVKKINKTNIKVVLNRWNESFRGPSGDTCLLETLYGEFKSDSNSKTSMTNQIVKAIEEFAKENGCYDKVSANLKILQGSSGDKNKYLALDSILSVLNSV